MEFIERHGDVLREYSRMSKASGGRSDYVQGGGGNTSAKLDGSLMAIKASGFCLKDIEPDSAYAVVDYAALRRFYGGHEPGDFEDVERAGSAEAKAATLAVEGLEALRPSVEAGFHSLLNTYVSHTHSVYANFAACAVGGRAVVEEALSGADYSWGFVRYVNPGSRLTFSIRDELKRVEGETGKRPAVIFMESHGLIVHGDGVDEVLRVQDDVNARIAAAFGLSGDSFPKVAVIGENGVYRVDCPYLKEQLGTGDFTEREFIYEPLYPDQLVFLGDGFSVGTGEPADGECVANPETGEVAIRMPEKKALVIAETLAAIIFIRRAITASGREVISLGDAARDFIANWESEKYRKQLAGKK